MDTGVITIARSLEKAARFGLRFKRTKTKYSRLSISVPTETLDVLREHRRQQPSSA